MCTPSVLASVRSELSRRQVIGGLIASAGTLAAAACGSSGSAAVGSDADTRHRPADEGVRLPNGFRQVFDLTHVLSPETPVYSAFKPMRFERLFTIDKDGFTCGELTLNEHTGTHMDAPVHFIATSTASVDMLPVEKFIAPLAVVSIKDRVDRNPDTGVSVDDILAWEKAHGRLPAGAFVAMHAGWDARYQDAKAFLNIDAAGVARLPGFTGAAAEFLIKERDIVGAGVDTVSLDMGTSASPAAHLAFLGAGKYGIEVINNLGTVPASGATVIVGPPKHKNGTGGPVRLLAVA